MTDSFSYFIFWDHPSNTLAFFFLIAAFISLWVKNRLWIWGSLLILSYFFAYKGEIVSLETLIPIGLLLMMHFTLHKPFQGISRFIIIFAAAVVSFGLMMHFIPGFSNWRVIYNIELTADAFPYTMYYNFDKPFVGFFILALNLPLIQDRESMNKMLFKTIPLAAAGILFLGVMAENLHFVRYAFKFPLFLPIWILGNLFFTTIPEEAFFRGFLQKELSDALFQIPRGGFISILITSIFFSLIHIKLVSNPLYLLLFFAAGIIYGSVYQFTKAIESSIFCHFCLNLTHILFFTYPALRLN